MKGASGSWPIRGPRSRAQKPVSGVRKLVITKSPEESCHSQLTRALGPHLAQVQCSCGPHVKNGIYIFK